MAEDGAIGGIGIGVGVKEFGISDFLIFAILSLHLLLWNKF